MYLAKESFKEYPRPRKGWILIKRNLRPTLSHIISPYPNLSHIIPLHSTLYRVIPPYPAHIDNDRHLSRGRHHGVGGQRLVRPRRWSGVLLGTSSFHHHHRLLVLFLIVQEKNLSVSILNMAVVMPTMMCTPCRDENSDTAWYFHLIFTSLTNLNQNKENLPLFPPETRDSKTENLFSTPWGQSSHYGQEIHMKILIVTCFSESISVAMAFRIWKWRRQF